VNAVVRVQEEIEGARARAIAPAQAAGLTHLDWLESEAIHIMR